MLRRSAVGGGAATALGAAAGGGRGLGRVALQRRQQHGPRGGPRAAGAGVGSSAMRVAPSDVIVGSWLSGAGVRCGVASAAAVAGRGRGCAAARVGVAGSVGRCITRRP